MTSTPNHPPLKYLQFEGDQSYRRYVQLNDPGKSPPSAPREQSHSEAQSHGSYGALLFHPNWKARRREILQRDMHRCVHCHSDGDLQVHHRQYHFLAGEQKYRLPWDYPDRLLITLCETCHSKGHSKFKVPTITIK